MTKTASRRRPLRAAPALLLLALLLAPAVRTATAQVGGAGVVFLMIEPDSRSAGMGNSGVALADNAYAIFWNPAGLAYQEGFETSITHSTWLPEFNAGLYYEYLVAKYHAPGWGTFGGHLTYLNLGEHEGRDAQGNPTDNFRSYDLAAGLSYGTKLTKNVAVGSAVRLIYSNLAPGQTVGAQETKAGVSAGFDVSALYRTQPIPMGGAKGTFSAGFNLANMGPKIQYSDSEQADPIPTNIRFGYSFKLDLDEYNSLTFANDFTKMLTHSEMDSTRGYPVADPFYKALFSSWQPIELRNLDAEGEDPQYQSVSVLQQLMIGTGMEYWYNQLFALRLGYFYENPYNGNRQFLTFGAGVRYNIVGVDFSYIYALEEDHPLSNTTRFSLLLNLKK